MTGRKDLRQHSVAGMWTTQRMKIIVVNVE